MFIIIGLIVLFLFSFLFSACIVSGGCSRMEEEKELQIIDGTYFEDVVDTLEVPDIENPDDREYENIEIEEEGGK